MGLRIDTTGLLGWHRTLALCIAACFGIVAAAADRPVRSAAAQAPPASAVAPAPVAARAGEDRLAQPQLEQLLAPIALYPDTLLAQMFMAATYPLEIVQAQRWLGRGNNAKLKGEELAQALQREPWDASVKSLVPFPDVLKMMNDQLEWTQQLGDAVLAQQQDVLNAVQVLRHRAQQAGKLQSGPELTVNVSQNVRVAPAGGGAPSEDATPAAIAVAPAAAPTVAPPPQVITIEPAQPDRVYVPAYDPSVVYGTWPYPSYPPAYYPPPVGWGLGSALLTGMAFAGGVALVGSMWGWAGCGWGSGDININSSRVRNIDRTRTGDVGNRWQHNTAHRQGVAYRSDEVRNRFQGNRPDPAATRDQFRGRLEQADRGGLGDRGGAGDRAGPGRSDRAGAGQATRAGDARPARTAAGERASAPGGGRARDVGHAANGRPMAGGQGASGRQGSGGTRGAQGFQGMGQGGDVRAASQRGNASRQSQPMALAAGGGGGRAASAGGGGGGRAGSAGFSGGGRGAAGAAGGGGGSRGGGGGRGGGGRGR
ncbi:DUF3300 domain-containing protein [Siccirubricoccus sp. G192]|uniref:DUF3300 domain-containing protein n=1 Tax=Siccirubricoccus sp. G192 TaxID=2849651 RepID=UPI001C2CB1CA|nr:DUF3300 domain-containing protein [Siccirubricoccus sp. G192]MBV1798930.1 DUF3300 domain-containing protein [Siccirubricoccus sp. G192]